MTVGVAIPSIPPRTALLQRAVNSVLAQSRPADAVTVVVDKDRRGAAATRNQAWRSLNTEWIAFLDDDDEFLPQHIERLLICAIQTRANLVYPWFEVVGGTDPFPSNFGRPWNPEDPVQTTITCLWQREWLEKIGGFREGFQPGIDSGGNRVGEDFLAVRSLSDAGGRVVHLPERTWRWHHHGGNTSGVPTRW